MIISLHTAAYPIETILQTCYHFIDKVYFHLDFDESGKKIIVKITFKAEGAKRAQAQEFRGKFLEELLHCSLRYTINQRNQKLREYIVGSALFSHNPSEAAVVPPEDVSLEEETKQTAVPWVKRNGK